MPDNVRPVGSTTCAERIPPDPRTQYRFRENWAAIFPGRIRRRAISLACRFAHGASDSWAASRLTSYNVCYTKLLRLKNGMEVNGKSIMGVLMLAAHRDSSVVVRAEGPDADEAVREIGDLIARKFDEEE